MLVSETAAPIWGYNAELERGMVVVEPPDEQRRLFDHVVDALQVAFDAFRPGVTCARRRQCRPRVLRRQRNRRAT
jgi:Xaa-Pro dipeptidase